MLSFGSTGDAVISLQHRLEALGYDPGAFDGSFGPSTRSALERFQQDHGLSADGIAGPDTLAALDLIDEPAAPSGRLSDISAKITPELVAPLFPGAPLSNIHRYLPSVLSALSAAGLGDRVMVCCALGTIRAECAPFAPLLEGASVWNTSGDSHDFDLYDGRSDLGNGPAPDGSLFKGRGFVQLTGRANYAFYGPVIGKPLVTTPDLAVDPVIAGKLLATFLWAHERKIRAALADNDLATARRQVNGGVHGLSEFSDTYLRGMAATAAL